MTTASPEPPITAAPAKAAKYLKTSTLGLTTAASIVTSLRGLPMMADEELTMFGYIAFSTLLFLIPAGLVAGGAKCSADCSPQSIRPTAGG